MASCKNDAFEPADVEDDFPVGEHDESMKSRKKTRDLTGNPQLNSVAGANISQC
jgi:hypothetical protein